MARPIGFEQIALSAETASALNPTAGAVSTEIQVEGGQVRFRPDGIDPTATVGWLLQDGDAIVTPAGEPLANCRFIAVDDMPVLNVIYT